MTYFPKLKEMVPCGLIIVDALLLHNPFFYTLRISAPLFKSKPRSDIKNHKDISTHRSHYHSIIFKKP